MNHWPAFILSLILAFFAITWWSLDRAASEVSAVTDPDYYNHGLHYNHTPPRGQEGGEWAVRQELTGRRLTIRVEDGRQAGVLGCRGQITFAASKADQEPPLPVTEAGAGVYTVELPASPAKTLAATLTLSKGETTVERRLLLALAP